MAKPLPRYLAISASDAFKVDRVVAAANENATPTTVTSATLPGDSRRLRGIPAIGRGVAGCVNNSNPLAETIRRDEQKRRRT